MKLNQILTISGKPGLYQLQSRTRSGFLALSLLDQKRISIGLRNNWRNKKKAIKGNNFQNASCLNMINLCKNWKIFENKLKMEEKYEKNIFVVRNNVSWTYEGRNITISDNLLLL